jgi:endonuclease/exonuclease/phosphatase family metal-dependent hydrolase
MKINIHLKIAAFILVCMLYSLSVAKAQVAILKVLTYNIRMATPDDTPNTWDNRKEHVFSNIREVKPGIFGLQEVLKVQLADFERAFPSYKRIGLARDDGKEAGEFSPLFYDSARFSLQSSSTFWLSQTPKVAGSRGWDAACNRVVTWGKFKETRSGKMFLVFCTHFDHMGEIARRNSANLLLKVVDSLSGKFPAIVLGDFNASPDSEPYKIITDGKNPAHLTDASLLCSEKQGPEITFTGFKVNGIPGQRIDYIFIKGIKKVVQYKVNSQNIGEYYPSDHLPVSAGLKVF